MLSVYKFLSSQMSPVGFPHLLMLLTFANLLQLPSVAALALNSVVLTTGGLHFLFSICKMVLKKGRISLQTD